MSAYPPLDLAFAERADWTLPRVLQRRAVSHRDATFIEIPEDQFSLTFGQTYQRSLGVAAGFINAGATNGDRVLIMASNRPELVLGWFGASCAGLVEAPINTAYRGRFLEHQVRTISPRFAIIEPEFAERFVESREACSSLEHFFVIGETAAAASAIDALRVAGWAADQFAVLFAAPVPEPVPVAPSETAAIFFTSGTTGLSKGVTMSHAHMHFFAEEYRDMTKLTDADVELTVLPLFHGNAQFAAVVPALLAGCKVIVRHRFSATRWSAIVRESGTTVTNLLGVMMDLIGKQPSDPLDSQNALRCIDAIPTAWSIVDGFKERFGVEHIVEAYGLTEVPNPILTPLGSDRPLGSAGLGVEEFFDIRIVDPATDQVVSDGGVGELVVRPKEPWIITSGYWGMPEATLGTFRNLWFHTGDSMRRDDQGWYYFVDRIKDAIRRKGENISSYEIEEAFLAHDGIHEAAAVAVPADGDAAAEDEVLLVCVRIKDAAVSAEDLWSWAEDRVPYFAIPRYVWFVDVLPKTPTERVEKVKLRATWHEGDVADRGPSVRRADAARS